MYCRMGEGIEVKLVIVLTLKLAMVSNFVITDIK